MANPQKEDGHTQIANELIEALCRTRIPGVAMQVFLTIIRKSYGFGKKMDGIPLSQFCLATNLKRDKIIRALHLLEKMNVIISQKGNAGWNYYGVNKDFDTWKPLPKKETFPKKEMTISQKGNASFPKKEHSKENSSKDNTSIIVTNVTTATQKSYEENLPKKKKRKSYTREEVDVMLAYLKKKIEIDAFVDSKIERNMATHCISLIRKIGKDEFVRRLEFLLIDDFTAKNCNKIYYVYNNIKGFKEPKSKQNTVFIS